LTPADFLNSLSNPSHDLVIERFGRTRVASSWVLQKRIIPEHYVTLLLRNEAVAEVAGVTYLLRPGSLLWLQPGVPHSYRPVDPEHPQTFLHLRFELREADRAMCVEESAILLPRAQILRPAFENLFDEHGLDQEFGQIRFRALLVAFLADLFRLYQREASRRELGGLDNTQRQILREYIERHLAESICARDLARLVKLSPDYFTRVFRATYGHSPRHWLLRERMSRAAGMLAESNLSISEVANSLGYGDIFTFSRLFKQCLGQSPRQYRLTHN
jgi:AraC-like DNA-binding protein